MLDLLVRHLFEYDATTLIRLPQTLHVAPQMGLHLAFRLGDKPEVGAPSEHPGQGTYRKGPGIPQGVENAGSAIEFAKPKFAPRQMVGLFRGGMAHGGGHRGIPRSECLSLVKSLGGHLAGMIDPHQPGRLPALRLA